MSAESLHTARETSIFRLLRDNGLSLTLGALFLIFMIGQALAGHAYYDQERMQHGQPSVTFAEYLTCGEFLEATTENWESEFLQMAAYVIFTSFLFQRGSPESKPVDAPHRQTGSE